MSYYFQNLDPSEIGHARAHELRRCPICKKPELRCVGARAYRFRYVYRHECSDCGHELTTESLFSAISSVFGAVGFTAFAIVLWVKTEASGSGVWVKFVVEATLIGASIGLVARTARRHAALRASPVVETPTDVS